MAALLLTTVFAFGFLIGLGFADAIARQRVKSWANVRELMGL